MKKKRWSVFLAALLLAGTLGAAVVPARADGDTPEIPALTGMSAVMNGDTVWFGSAGSGAVAWRVLSAAGHKHEKLNTSGTDEVLLLAESVKAEDAVGFGDNNRWAESAAKQRCADYYDAFAENSSELEAALVKTTNVDEGTKNYDVNCGSYVMTFAPVNVSGEKFFLLSAKEAMALLYLQKDRALPDKCNWWLRSPSVDRSTSYITSKLVGIMDHEGRLAECRSTESQFYDPYDPEEFLGYNCMRPAFNLDPSAVVLASPATGGKSDNAAIRMTPSTTHEWKLTLQDSERTGFDAALSEATELSDGTVQLTFSGARTGKNEYVTAVLCDAAGAAIACGGVPVGEKAAGTAVFTVPYLAPGVYTMKVFNEERNGDYLSDYAGNVVEFRLTVQCKVEGRWDGSVLTAETAAPTGARLIAARYDANGRMTGVKTFCVEDGITSYNTEWTKAGGTYRLIIIDSKTFAPLCEAWDSTAATG